MLLDDVWHRCESALFSTPSTSTLFNLYRDRNTDLDRPDASSIRRANLRRYLACYDERPPLFLLAEAPGPWGCRFSGIPITSEEQLVDDGFPIDGRPSSARDEPHGEYSANIFWRVLHPYFPAFFVWNSVPFHPHDPDEPLSIRTPRRSEIAAYGDLLSALLDVLQPERIAAIGRKAEYAFTKIGEECTYVRHPSQGGAKKFEAGILEIVRDLGLADGV